MAMPAYAPYGEAVARVPAIGPDGLHRIPTDQDHVVEPPVWGDARRSRNWLAIVEEDPQAPGGVRRTFCARGRGRFRYSLVSVLPGDLLEFGADYLSCGGNRYRERWHATVVELGEHELVVKHHPDLASMLAADYKTRAAQAQDTQNPGAEP